MKIHIHKISLAVASGLLLLASCKHDPDSPGVEYMPDMYRSPSYESNSPNALFADSMTNRPPVEGTISQGSVPNSEYSIDQAPYPYKNDSLGYELAGQYLKDPFPASAEIVAEGQDLFGKFCVHCHGDGTGNGTIVANGKFPPPPSYSGALKNLPEGKMFHTLQYGKNLMGSHASQLTKSERWKIIRYVQTLQGPKDTATAATKVAEKEPVKDGKKPAEKKDKGS